MTALVPVRWPAAFRVIRSIYPPIDLFEDIADPADWEALASAESKTNPRVWDHVGNLSLVPPERRVSGPGSSFLMAPFVHVSRDRPGRFTDGSYGVFSVGSTEETALREVAHHHGRFMSMSEEPTGWTSQFRMLVTHLDLDLNEVRPRVDCHDPADYGVSQALGRTLWNDGSNGVIYRSVRAEGTECAGIFWPDLVAPPVQADHFDYHWDGATVDRIRNCRTGQIYGL